MNCKRCHAPLPSSGYVCLNCGAMMSLDQIKQQKEMFEQNQNHPVEMVSERYGRKKFIFKKREEERKKYTGILFLLIIVLFLLLIGIFVYF